MHERPRVHVQQRTRCADRLASSSRRRLGGRKSHPTFQIERSQLAQRHLRVLGILLSATGLVAVRIEVCSGSSSPERQNKGQHNSIRQLTRLGNLDTKTAKMLRSRKIAPGNS